MASPSRKLLGQQDQAWIAPRVTAPAGATRCQSLPVGVLGDRRRTRSRVGEGRRTGDPGVIADDARIGRRQAGSHHRKRRYLTSRFRWARGGSDHYGERRPPHCSFRGDEFEADAAARPSNGAELDSGLLPRPGAWIGVSQVGREEEEMVGVLPTLLPKTANCPPEPSNESAPFAGHKPMGLKRSNLRPWDQESPPALLSLRPVPRFPAW